MRCCWPRREDRSTPRAGRAGQPHRSDRPRLGAGSGRIGRLVESGSSDGHGACELTSAAQDMINTKICGAAPGGGGNGSVAGGVRRRGGESALGGAARSAASSVRAGAYENAYVRSLIPKRQHTPTRHTPRLHGESGAVSEGQISNLAVGRQDASLSFTRARGAPDHPSVVESVHSGRTQKVARPVLRPKRPVVGA